MMMQTIEAAAEALASGKTTASALAEASLARIEDPAGEGRRAFIAVDAAAVRAAAAAMDQLRGAGHAPTRYAGIPIAIKDLAARDDDLWPNAEVSRARKALEGARAAAVEALRAARYFVKQADWLQERFEAGANQ